MGLVPVNAPQVTSVVGHRPATDDDEFVIRRLEVNRQLDHKAETSDDRDSKGHRGTDTTSNRGKGDESKDGGKGHQR